MICVHMSACLKLYVLYGISRKLMAWQLLAFVQFSLFDKMEINFLSEVAKGSNLLKQLVFKIIFSDWKLTKQSYVIVFKIRELIMVIFKPNIDDSLATEK